MAILVAPPSGLTKSYAIYTPGCTGGHNCQDPSDLGIIKILQQMNVRSFSLSAAAEREKKTKKKPRTTGAFQKLIE